MNRKYKATTTEKLWHMFHDIMSQKPEEKKENRWDKYLVARIEEKDIDKEGYINSDFKLSESYTVDKLFELYDKHVPLERRLFCLEYDAHEFQGIFTIEELMIKLEKDHYFDKDFWSYHKSKEDARKDFESYRLDDVMNIAYERLWGVSRIV